MKFSFRGIHYNCQPQTLEVTEGEVGGTYRGSPWRVHYPQQEPQRTFPCQLRYRGIPYKKG